MGNYRDYWGKGWVRDVDCLDLGRHLNSGPLVAILRLGIVLIESRRDHFLYGSVLLMYESVYNCIAFGLGRVSYSCCALNKPFTPRSVVSTTRYDLAFDTIFSVVARHY